MKIIYDGRMPGAYLDNIVRNMSGAEFIGFDGPDTGSECYVYRSILSHPDIYFFQIEPDTIIYAPSVPVALIEKIKGSGIKLIKGEIRPHGNYPCTASYNAVRVGNKVFHNTSISDRRILEEAAGRGLEQVHVSQGYARCSVVVVDDNSIITPDEGIAQAARKVSLDVLLLPPGHVVLPGEKYGFIGGASGSIPGYKVIFAGDINTHPFSVQIRNFIKERGVELCSGKGPIYDFGGLIIIP